ncbi:unnamed protein product [Rotaria sordida]|uniref:ADP ribosyltransferase domain-containing protein n=1 Tax=Rotaria sordida TaxID=392033 RepID=A0A815RZM9_9BILA|nr:unnamed protein product [Rotaria sordida]CAF1648360.1 unnamed protein product [Rotaria sordida]
MASKMSERRRQRMAENYLVIWVDGNIDMANEDCQNTLAQLRGVVNEVNPCTTAEQCIEELQKNNEETSFVISSGALGQHLVPEIHGMPKLDAIYIFCGNKQRHQEWAKNWPKIKGVHTSIKHICKKLALAVKQCNQDQVTVSIIGANEGGSSEDLNQLEPSFMYTQIFKEILLDMEHDQQAIKDLVIFCQEQYQGNTKELKLIKEFERTYRPSKAIWWYTRQCFTYKMLNRALRTLDGDIIIRMGFYLCDVHRQIETLHTKQVSQYHGKTFLVYRGQGLSKVDHEKLVKSKGGLISFNNFLSTSKNRNVSLAFANEALGTEGMVGVLFQMTIDPMVSSTPFASIKEVSDFAQEEEILFSMHTVFRIGEVRKIDKKSPLYEVELKLTSDDDQQLRQLTNRIREEVDGTGWYRLGKLLLKIGQFGKAEELYTALLEQASDDSDKAYIYNQLGWSKDDQGQYKEAASFYEISLEIKQKTLPEDHPSLAPTYSNIGLVYNNMGDYSKALEFYKKSHKIREKALSPNDPDLAASYGGIGYVYNNMGDYSKALEFYENSHKIYEKALPPNHPNLAISYNNIGQVYNNMGDYSKALDFFKKSQKIFVETLPANHPHLAFPYNWFGKIYRSMKDYPKALDNFEKCLSIRQKALPENHPDIAFAFSNIGDVHRLMGNYEEALAFQQKALNIQENVQCNPLECALTYINLGETYREMKDYSTALTYFEKGLEIREKKLSKNHPDLAVVYHNMAKLYLATRKYSMAMKNIQQTVEIAQEKLPSTHPHLLEYKGTFEKIRKKM